MNIFAITLNGKFNTERFYSTKEIARKYLVEIKNSLTINDKTWVIRDDEDTFYFEAEWSPVYSNIYEVTEVCLDIEENKKIIKDILE